MKKASMMLRYSDAFIRRAGSRFFGILEAAQSEWRGGTARTCLRDKTQRIRGAAMIDRKHSRALSGFVAASGTVAASGNITTKGRLICWLLFSSR